MPVTEINAATLRRQLLDHPPRDPDGWSAAAEERHLIAVLASCDGRLFIGVGTAGIPDRNEPSNELYLDDVLSWPCGQPEDAIEWRECLHIPVGTVQLAADCGPSISDSVAAPIAHRRGGELAISSELGDDVIIWYTDDGRGRLYQITDDIAH